jgi:hypothetical protein
MVPWNRISQNFRNGWKRLNGVNHFDLSYLFINNFIYIINPLCLLILLLIIIMIILINAPLKSIDQLKLKSPIPIVYINRNFLKSLKKIGTQQISISKLREILLFRTLFSVKLYPFTPDAISISIKTLCFRVFSLM